MLNKVYVWHDKIDGVYMPDSMMVARSERAVCRGYLNAFANDKKMNPAEYELCKVATFDDETCEFKAIYPPIVVDPMQVYARQPDTNGDVLDE